MPRVPTGINTGVSTMPCDVSSNPALALVSFDSDVILKLNMFKYRC